MASCLMGLKCESPEMKTTFQIVYKLIGRRIRSSVWLFVTHSLAHQMLSTSTPTISTTVITPKHF